MNDFDWAMIGLISFSAFVSLGGAWWVSRGSTDNDEELYASPALAQPDQCDRVDDDRNAKSPSTTLAPPPPPEGYENWLQFAIVHFDARSAAIDWLLDNDHHSKIDEIREAVWADMNDLRQRAGLPRWQPPLF